MLSKYLINIFYTVTSIGYFTIWWTRMSLNKQLGNKLFLSQETIAIKKKGTDLKFGLYAAKSEVWEQTGGRKQRTAQFGIAWLFSRDEKAFTFTNCQKRWMAIVQYSWGITPICQEQKPVDLCQEKGRLWKYPKGIKVSAVPILVLKVQNWFDW